MEIEFLANFCPEEAKVKFVTCMLRDGARE